MRPLRTCMLSTFAVSLLAAPAALAASPSATTLGASGIGHTSATLRGRVVPGGKATTYVFQFGTSAAYGSQTAPRSAGSGTSSVSVGVKVSSLSAGTTYHFRLVATNADGTSAGSDATFKTSPSPVKPPIVLATAPFAPSANGITFTALLNPNGGTTTYRFQYGTSTAYGLETFGKSISSGHSARSVRFRVASLAPRTTYHFRVVASNSAGTTIGPDTLAQTGPFPPARFELLTRPRHARRAHPFYVTRGRIVLGSGVSPAEGCSSGRIVVRFTSGHRTLAVASSGLAGGHCSFRLRMRIAASRRVHRLRVHVRFAGNAILAPFTAPSFLVRLG
jgi:hypothetical protein